MTEGPILGGVEAFLFDVFGTVVDWRGSLAEGLRNANPHLEEDWGVFAQEWIKGHYIKCRGVASGGPGATSVDVLHREYLDEMLQHDRWEHLADQLSDTKRQELTLLYHKLNGWPDTTEGLYALKKKAIIGSLSNGNARLLVDMAKHADLPWDVVLSGDIIGSYKPNPKMYLTAAQLLGLDPQKCCLVAAHLYDLRAAASHGFRTVYVRRPTEDTLEERDSIRSKQDGGEMAHTSTT
ncbi:unnamed protein product [Somion occarium]|uniref:Haloacid dehalogenase n=1 Tax=Somion occarium TaxID=3059160 RepID=A0ABP1CN43_9APHY